MKCTAVKKTTAWRLVEKLGIRIQQLVESGRINILTPFHINGVYPANDKITVTGELNGKNSHSAISRKSL
ncbi:hypothetical protein RCO48_36950 [Peribacillus frigoritolerans]|nr:hypothetical protein [Peribacillus frigoritolerans]